MRTLRTHWLVLLATALPLTLGLGAPAPAEAQVDPGLFQAMRYRNIGPFRGGRVTTVTGVPGETFTFYMGATGGGVWKTTDAGTTWRNISDGYFNTTGIGAVVVAPSDPNVIYVGTGESPVRGVKTSHGDGVYKSTDAGATWTHLGLEATRHTGQILVHPRNPDRVWVGAQGNPYGPNEERGVYRSDDAGETFRQVSNDPTTFARAWYYMHIIADPQDPDEVWVMNSGPMKSIDGGKTYTRMPDSHVDHHALWINPENSDIMINGNDGGAAVTLNGGRTWSTQLNQPTAQMYRVMTDNLYPYNVYSGQQDASGIVIASQTLGDGIGEHDWQTIRSGESATVGLDPENPRYVYTTFFASFLGEWDAETWNYRMVRPYPERVTGEQPKNLKYRANWNGPVFVSPHDPRVIYYGSQYVHKSTDRGTTWEVISEDLTRNDKDHQGLGGYPISNEQITAESYNDVFNIEESPLQEGVIWVGSDDGLVHVTRDGGRTWTNVTPGDLPESIINVVEPSPHDAATAYFAAAGYKMNDFRPYIYKTDDYGETWTKIVRGIPGNTFARSVREDPDRRGLLYAGTETGMYVSFDDGGMWQELQLNLPEVPVTDLRIRQKDLVVSTQGRSLWILDDLTPLHQISDAVAGADYYLYKPRDAVRKITPGYYAEGGLGENPPSGMQIHYVLNAEVSEDTPMSMEILDGRGRVVYSEFTDDDSPPCPAAPKSRSLTREPGDNVWSWDMQVGRFACLDEITLTSRDLSAYPAVPGNYQARFTVGDFTQTQDFRIVMDPRIEGIVADPVAQYAELDRLSSSLYDAATAMADGVSELRQVKRQLELVLELSDAQQVHAEGEALDEIVEGWIEEILQKELKTSQHNYQFEARLLLKYKDLLGRMGGATLPLTQGVRDVTRDYLNVWSGLATELQRIKSEDVPAFNQTLRAAGLPEIYLPRPIS